MTSPNIFLVTLNILNYFSNSGVTCIPSACTITDSSGIQLSRMNSPTLLYSGVNGVNDATCTFTIDTSIVLSQTDMYIKLDSSTYNNPSVQSNPISI